MHIFNKNVYSFFQETGDIYQGIDYTKNNMLQKNSHLEALNSLGVTIWISSKGEFCYRTSSNLNITHTTPLKNASIILSNLLGYDVQIIKKSKPIESDNVDSKVKSKVTTNYNPHIIYLSDLFLVTKEVFAPTKADEFFKPDTFSPYYYRNTFIRSRYLLPNPLLIRMRQSHLSITLQFIYYLANYQEDRFHCIMHWLASFFKDFSNKSKKILILLGNNESGKEILFNEIIKPLFGQEYCLKITDEILESTFIQKLLTNKLFYNIDNVSDSVIKDKKTKKIINDLLSKNSIEVIESKGTLTEHPIHGQILITIDEARLTYINKDFESFILFKVPDESTIVQHFAANQESLSSNTQRANDFESHLNTLNIASKSNLIDAIRNDLINFCTILKTYKIDIHRSQASIEIEDDKKILQMSLEDKVKEFHNAILNYKNNIKYFEENKKKLEENEKEENLYETLISDFQINRIKQPNLIKYFQAIYNEEKNLSKRSLMSKLRKVDARFYDVSNIKSKSGGTKYFELS